MLLDALQVLGPSLGPAAQLEVRPRGLDGLGRLRLEKQLLRGYEVYSTKYDASPIKCDPSPLPCPRPLRALPKIARRDNGMQTYPNPYP